MDTAATDTAKDVAAIRRLVEQANALQSDREPFIALHTPDTVIVNIAGRRVVGRETLDRAMAGAMASQLAKVVTRNEVEDITFIRRDVALVACTKHVEDHNPDAAERALPTRATLTYLVVDDGGGWRIALAQTTPLRSG